MTNTEIDIQAILESITCPITRDIMTDPVLGSDGHTYQRNAIVTWLQNHSNSPMTNSQMTIDDLKVNPSIRFLVDKYHAGSFGDVGIVRPSAIVSTDGIKLKSSSSIYNGPDIDYTKVMITLAVDEDTIPDGLKGQTLPQDVVCVIDHSGSMGANVEAKDEDGKSMEDGLSQLDLVGYAVRTVGATLKPRDRLGIISFDNIIKTEYPLREMTEMNFNSLGDVIGNIKPGGSTNIWHAIEAALNLLHERDDKSRNAHIILLTDGVPNTARPGRGESAELDSLHRNINFSTSINTIGFGYSLEEKLLYNLAKAGNGVTAHIPDGGMIATVFNNLTGTILCSVAMNVEICAKLIGGSGFKFCDKPVSGDFSCEFVPDTNNTEILINAGTVQQGQLRNLILNVEGSGDHDIRDSIMYSYSYKIGGVSTQNEYKFIKDDIPSTVDLKSQITRYFMIEKIRQAIGTKEYELTGRTKQVTTKMIYDELVEYFESRPINDALTRGLYTTLTDQVYMALSVNNELHTTLYRGRQVSYFKKWGYFYLDQLCCNMNFEKRPNYKDAACESFGGKLFTEIVDYGSDKFNTLTPPVPSNVSSNWNAGGMPPAPLTAQRVSTYNSQVGPCFDGNSYVKLANDTSIKVNVLRKGDEVATISDHTDVKGNGGQICVAKVVCVLKTIMRNGFLDLIELKNGARMTPWHPVMSKNGWVPARDVGVLKEKTACDAVYSIVLDSHHVILINNLPCICLGHNYKTAGLVHPYLGTNLVIDDLKTMPGWRSGIIKTLNGGLERDSSGLICKIRYITDKRTVYSVMNSASGIETGMGCCI